MQLPGSSCLSVGLSLASIRSGPGGHSLSTHQAASNPFPLPLVPSRSPSKAFILKPPRQALHIISNRPNALCCVYINLYSHKTQIVA
ncbi:hypothetical protein P691DRAFT_802182 [Macrolepiota fuliginosa MF-IS2]|uniref:Uncharacterized protein n=1 Tax=Macrolepiota fuliginosa MF-IS2 TaxID=1400762 RepID=A0A9P5WZB5_9AGAR|nr:hypothetical protein P691DRAFT_802182 [Macrolepiota fuliginosa MF-IS2]